MEKSTISKYDQKRSTKIYGINVTPYDSAPVKPNLDGDRLNFYLLILLYIIQGFPLGLSSSFPIILQSKKMVTYEDQATFSIALWPYIMNILWAPIIDALYIQCVGRRKCWLIPLQLLMGLFMFYMACNIADWLPESGKPNLKMLSIMVFVLNVLSSTQDIVVDGWALTMLKKNNVSYTATCNSTGILFGIFLGEVCFTLLVSEEFNIKYFRAMPGAGGLVSMKSCLLCWVILVVSVTLLIGIFKKEKKNLEDDFEKISVFQNYKLLWEIIKLPNIKGLAIALLTTRIGFIVTESVSQLKLIDAGLSKDDIMILTTIMYVVKFTIPIFISKYITSIKPMSYYLKMTPIRLVWGIVYVTLIYFTPSLIHLDNAEVSVPVYYYLTLGFVYFINDMLSFFMLLALFSFFYQISDSRFGGTYMTLFNTLYFLGWFLPNTLVLKLIDITTFSKCSNDAQNLCSTPNLTNMCNKNGGSCSIYVDGYYITTAVCAVIGLVWYCTFKNTLKRYQTLSRTRWMVYAKPSDIDEVHEPCITSS
ncbi:acetyl-coenzyme A transporter 1-like [Rhopalosiphum maidis]|uniref:acetyl-coenzyme A transporter 1-like n=1 Tax=Rhopalosiphum maidis TaxID=43146 RepID=UPI000F00961C|nr:acetyl-coenzyme A transporter 1-like [Rhopalosiphum maidis]XP_026823090.1 acetyl-coenzyme A transporter 1-like [Rhopalosiphum maidis]XP_026823091.1 acetyl-coenzyme A transporter 1-like [Rhopalosiphum maidis]